MKRIVTALTLAGLLLGSVPSVRAQDWAYAPVGYPPPQQQDHPILKKVLIGAGLVGIGYLIGRATAPKPGPVYTQPPIQYGPRPGAGIPWQQGNGPQHHHRAPTMFTGRSF